MNNQKGAVPLILLLGIIGIVAIMFVANAAPFKDSFLSSLYPKDQSMAAENDSKSKDKGVEFSSTEVLIKFKPTSGSGTRGTSSQISAVSQRLRKYNYKSLEKTAANAKSDLGWYKVTLDGTREVVKQTSSDTGFNQSITARGIVSQTFNDKMEPTLTSSKAKTIQDMVADLKSDPNIEFAQPNYVIRASFTPNDPLFSSSNSWDQGYKDLWGLQTDKLNMPQAWDITQGQGVIVAVVDTGVDYNHADIKNNIWVNANEFGPIASEGKAPNCSSRGLASNKNCNNIDDDGNGYIDDYKGGDFADSLNDPMDQHGHGSHVAGIIAATGNNGIGIIGVAPQSKIMPIKALNDFGWGYTTDLANGILYASINGAKVINNSWGGNSETDYILEDAVRVATQRGSTLVFAAGNDTEGVYASPQNMTLPKPIIVSASDNLDKPTSFTNFGYQIDVSAPGGGSSDGPFYLVNNILSLKAGNQMDSTGSNLVDRAYLRAAGTSMAAPYVSGVAALLFAKYPSLNPEQVRNILKASADDVGIQGPDLMTGAGRVNAYKALSLGTANVNLRIDPSVIKTYTPSDKNIIIKGSAAGSDFAKYDLYYKQTFASSWNQLQSNLTAPIDNNTLGSWDISSVPEGSYLIRLVVTSKNNQAFQDYIEVGIDNSPEIISNEPGYIEADAEADGVNIVWSNYRPYDFSDIWLLNTSTKQKRQITSGPRSEYYPAISGDLIVWTDGRGDVSDSEGSPDIYLYDLSLNKEVPISVKPGTQFYPAISGNNIAWIDVQGQTFKLFSCVYNRSTGACPEKLIAEGTSHVAISGDNLVYMEYVNDPIKNVSGWRIHYYNLASDQNRILATTAYHAMYPRISKDNIVYQGSEIHHYNLTSNKDTTISKTGFRACCVNISETSIIWSDNRNGNYDVYRYDLALKKESQVTASLRDEAASAVYNNKIIYEQYLPINIDLLQKTFTPSQPPPPTPPPTPTPSSSPSPTPRPKTVFGDFDGDGRADYATFRPSNSNWYIKTRTGDLGGGFGGNGDIPVIGDYDGDGKMNKAVYRPSVNTWYVDNENPNGTVMGQTGDLPVPGDYNGDGKTDKAMYRIANGTWETTGGNFGWGRPQNAIPVPADYNGDGKVEPAWFSNGSWFIQSNPSVVTSWGGAGDIPVPADYNGDGKAEPAVFRSGTWYILGQDMNGTSWGQPGDIPVPADYNGDGKADLTLFRPSNGTWYSHPSGGFSTSGIVLGQNGDIPAEKRPAYPGYPF